MRKNIDFYYHEIRKIKGEVADMPVKKEHVDAVTDTLQRCIEMFDYVNLWWVNGSSHYALMDMVSGGKRCKYVLEGMIDAARYRLGDYYMEHIGFIRYTQEYMCPAERLITLMYMWTATELYYYPWFKQDDTKKLYTLTDELWEMIPPELISKAPDGIKSAEEARQKFYFSKKKSHDARKDGKDE